MMKFVVLALCFAAGSAFNMPVTRMTRNSVTMTAEPRREFMTKVAAGAVVALSGGAANALIDDNVVPFLGGDKTRVDINNSNIRVYLKYPGMYPNVAGKIVSNGPYKSASDVKAVLNSKEQAVFD